MTMTELNQQPPPQYQPSVPPPPYAPPPPAKRRHRFRNFVVLPLLALVAVIVLATAVGGSGGSPAGDTADPAGSGVAPANRTDPRPVTPGAAFTIGKHRFDAGWKLGYDDVMGSTLSGTVTNVSHSTSSALFNVKFLRGATVLANFQCASGELEPGQTEAITCTNDVTPTDRVSNWTAVTAEATF
jgi:hypothetical protein